MKVCMVVGSFPPARCGIGDYTEKLSLHLAGIGLQVYIITSARYSSCNLPDIPNLKFCPVINEWNFASWRTMLETIKEIGPDIVHIQYPTKEYQKSLFINFLPVWLKYGLNMKVVETIHEYTIFSYKGRIRNLINFSGSHAIISVEAGYAKEIKKLCPGITRNFNIIHIPVSSSIPPSLMKENELKVLRAQLGISGEELLLSYFGFIDNHKGFDTLLQSLCILLTRNKRVKLLVVGELDLENNEYHRCINALMERLGLSGKVIWTGFVEKPEMVADYLAATDICIFPFAKGVSERNTSFLAAINQGIPIITTSYNLEGYQREQNVFYVEPGKPELIAEAVDRFYEIGLQRKPYRAGFSWHNMADRTLAVYMSVINNQ